MKRVVAFILVFAVMLTTTVFIHEITHSMIFRYFGCEKTEIGISWEGAYCKCIDEDHIKTDEHRLAHSINEVITYNLTYHLVLLEVLLIVLIMRLD